MSETLKTDSRQMLGRLREIMAEGGGQTRLDRITRLIAEEMRAEVCSIYLFRDTDTLELCATEGLKAGSVHQTRLRLGEGLVGRVARSGTVVNTDDAPAAPGFRYMPETGEEAYSSFVGVPIQRLGEKLGVLVTQSKQARLFSDEEVSALEVVAMVLAEMTELGAFVGEGAAMRARHSEPVMVPRHQRAGGRGAGSCLAARAARGHHQPDRRGSRPRGDAPARGRRDAARRGGPDARHGAGRRQGPARRARAYRMFANSKGWMRRMEGNIDSGLSAEAAVEKEQSAARARMTQVADSYLRERLHDLDDLSNRLLRILTGQGSETGAEMPRDPILVARNIGPAELLDYGRSLRGIVLEEGAVGSHAAIVARALAIPLVIHAERITTEALNGDAILVDGDQGMVHLRPDDAVAAAFRDKMAMQAEAQERYASIRDKPAEALCGTRITLKMNAGLMADLPSLEGSGAEGVGLFRTELQFLIRSHMPKRAELSALYSRVIDAAKGRRVVFRTLDIGSDKVLPYMKATDEPNPAMGWRAVRVALEKPGVMRMQLQALIRAARGGRSR